jgi:hypothetical protein
MSDNQLLKGFDRLNPLNDFAFQKSMGEHGDETQLMAFLNAVLERTSKGNIKSVTILQDKDIPAEILAGSITGLSNLHEISVKARTMPPLRR